MKRNVVLNTLDLFAGCGGLTEGFLQSGHYHTIGAVEWERAPRETLKHRLQTAWGYNDADNVVVRFDIQRTEELIHGFDDPVYGLHEGLENLVGGLYMWISTMKKMTLGIKLMLGAKMQRMTIL